MEWKLAWDYVQVVNSHFVQDPTRMMPGFDLCRVAWKNLNRIRTNCGRCNYWLDKWGILDSASCGCGALEQTISHIICFCPIALFDGDIPQLNE